MSALEPPVMIGFALTLLRAAGLVVAAPVIAGAAVPPRVRMALALALSAAGFVYAGQPAAALSGGPLVLAVLVESSLGIVVGLTARFALDAALGAGSAIGVSMGMGFGTLIDPASSESTSPGAVLLSMLALGFAVALGLHEEAVVWFCVSLRTWPPGQTQGFVEVLRFALLEGIRAIGLAVRLAFPVLAATTLAHVVLGLLGRFAPQLNLSSLGFSVAIVAGSASLYFTAPAIAEFAARAAGDALAQLIGG